MTAPKINLTAVGIVLIDPKFAFNVGAAVRLAAAYGVYNVVFTGERVEEDLLDQDSGRLPREERMKGYRSVWFRRNDRPFVNSRWDRQNTVGHTIQVARPTPIAVEVREGAEPLHTFVHPTDAIYVFGPEDGSLSPAILAVCHRVVVIPVRHCLNLATAVATVLWDRQVKMQPDGEFITPGDFEKRGTHD